MILLCTDSLRGYGINRAFSLVKEAGYDGIDLSVDFGQYDTFNASYLNKVSKETGIPIHAISAPAQISSKRIKDVIDLAKEVNAKVVILQPPRIFDLKLAAWLKREIPKLREKEFISIALENAPAGTFLGIIPEHALSNTADLKKFKHISLDTARIADKQKDLMRAYATFKKFLVHIHLSNVYHGKKYAPPMEGIMPLESFLTKLKQENYPGALSVKVLPKYLHAGDDEKVIKNLKEIKDFYDKYYTKVEAKEDPEDDEKM